MAARRIGARQGRKNAPQAKSESPEGKFRGILIRVNDEGLRALRLLAVEQDRRIQALGIEALNDLLIKHGKRPVVRNPLTDV